MNLNKIEKFILTELFKASSKKLDSYNIYKKFPIGISTFNKTIESLVDKNFISKNDFTLTLLSSGIELLLSKKNLVNKTQDFKKIPKEFVLKEKLEINDLYIPNIKILDEELR
ncbi:hypothetical protein [Aliarcobacter butzleri]|uniref:hypothetical protein n=1 Tax=Aliarcobacter butzleri TaxID=28197 RepID=UPI00263EC5D2|nr:hypothetical protein [Aliarcobacter butzleri]MDN5049678.1 hypothetical protein [Aliarcobacter butzleri]MDN5056519.1 hypothetical protein [Aliarcobacter butzleri]